LLVALGALLAGSAEPGRAQEPAIVDPAEACAAATPTISGAGTIAGTVGADVIFGSDGDDVIDGGPGDDLICGGGGNDTIIGGDGRDVIYGGDGDDVIDGGNGRDILAGGPGSDILRGGQSGDYLDGGDGDDALYGEGDNDILIGGPGQDVCEGGTGKDQEDPSCEIVAGPLGLGSPAGEDATGLAITHGLASGDVTARNAVVWARASRAAAMQVEYDTDPAFRRPELRSGEATAESDFTATVLLDGLRPDTRYHYRVRFSATAEDGSSLTTDSQNGSFRTAPEADTSRGVSFVFAGNLGGQRYCRRVEQGYPIFWAIRALGPDFFVANGDMVEADWDCPSTPPVEAPDWQNIPGDFPAIDGASIDWTELPLVREIYHRHWRYNRADVPFQEMLRTTPMYAQWDDHEVINDFGGEWAYWNAAAVERAGYPNLVEAGREAFFSYAPLARHPAEPDRIYRSYTWGRDLELFMLDGRSHRSRNDLADSEENAKTLLGRPQLEWLKWGLAGSRAIWKVVSTDVALSVPTGTRPSVFGRDSFANGTQPDYSMATGFERELLELLRFLDDHKVRNVVFISSHTLYPQTTRHRLDLNGDGDVLQFHQILAGLLSGRREVPRELDPTLRPTLLYAEGGLFNFGYVRIERQADGQVHLLAEVRDEEGQPRPGSLLDLRPD
jgi:alkaline phosphatase D